MKKKKINHKILFVYDLGRTLNIGKLNFKTYNYMKIYVKRCKNLYFKYYEFLIYIQN